jgi:glycosyltransferase involved in cell wall biosynthesis
MIASTLHFIFVGSFRERAKDGSVGGQMYACRTLLHSPLSAYVSWIPLDSTMEALLPPSFARRLLLAAKRVVVFSWLMLRRKLDGVLIFTADGLSFAEKGLMVLLAHLCRKRVLLSPRSGFALDDLQKSCFMQWYIPFVLRRCERIICQSHYWKQVYQAISGLPESRFAVVKSWIDTTPYAGLTAPTEASPVVVLFMGWIVRNKGIFDLVEAVRRFRDDLHAARFVICGGGPELETLQQWIADLQLSSSFDFRGWVFGAEKFLVLQQATIFVLPSYREGVPNALLEAMAAGRAVVATRVGGIPDLIIDESMGRLVEAGDPEALGKALVELCHNPALRYALGAKAHEHILAHHDINQISYQFLDILRGRDRLAT